MALASRVQYEKMKAEMDSGNENSNRDKVMAAKRIIKPKKSFKEMTAAEYETYLKESGSTTFNQYVR